MEQIRFNNGVIDLVVGQRFLFSDIVIARTGELVPESASDDERLQAMRLVRDALNAELSARCAQKSQHTIQFENMTKNIKPERPPYFVR